MTNSGGRTAVGCWARRLGAASASVAFFVLTLIGCVSTHWTPYSVAAGWQPRVVGSAIVVSPGDLRYLARCGAVIGTVSVSKPSGSVWSLEGPAAREAAAHGATHIIFADAQTVVDGFVATRAGETVIVQPTGQTAHVYTAIRVRAQCWRTLPSPIRPNGR